jgi:hypothetical protein
MWRGGWQRFYPELCPLLGCLPFGIALVMPAVHIISPDELRAFGRDRTVSVAAQPAAKQPYRVDVRYQRVDRMSGSAAEIEQASSAADAKGTPGLRRRNARPNHYGGAHQRNATASIGPLMLMLSSAFPDGNL